MAYDVLSDRSPRFVTPAGYGVADSPMSTESAVTLDGDPFVRARDNPLLTAQRWPQPVNAVLNPGAALVDGITILLCRVEDRRGISQIVVARSADGVTNWVIENTPLLSPSDGHPQEVWGVEDPGSPGSMNWTAG